LLEHTKDEVLSEKAIAEAAAAAKDTSQIVWSRTPHNL
jgi:hypothetical protein